MANLFLASNLSGRIDFAASVSVTEAMENTVKEYANTYKLSIEPLLKEGNSIAISKQQNVEKGDNAANEVVLKLAEPLSYLQVRLDKYGKPATLINYAAIWEKWAKDIRPFVENSYSGEWVDVVVRKMNTLLTKPKDILSYVMQHDWILQQYFAVPKDLELLYDKTSVLNAYWLDNVGSAKKLLVHEQWKTQTLYDMQLEGSLKGPITATSLQKKGWYKIDDVSGWCNAFNCNYRIKSADTEKLIQLTLSKR